MKYVNFVPKNKKGFFETAKKGFFRHNQKCTEK